MSLRRSRTRFDATGFEYVIADSHTALLRVEGTWADEPGPDASVVLLAGGEGGVSELRPLPDVAQTGGPVWRAAYPANPALLTPGVRFSLRAGHSRPVDLPAPRRRGLADDMAAAENERAARHVAEAELRDTRRELDRARAGAEALSAGVREAVAAGGARLEAAEAALVAVRDSLAAPGGAGAGAEQSHDERVAALVAQGAERAAAIEDGLRAIRTELAGAS